MSRPSRLCLISPFAVLYVLLLLLLTPHAAASGSPPANALTAAAQLTANAPTVPPADPLELVFSSDIVESLTNYSNWLDLRSNSSDPCAQLADSLMSNSGLTIQSMVKKCYNFFELVPDIRDQTVNSLVLFVNNYVFLEESMNSPGSFGMYDMQGQVEGLQRKQYDNDREFHENVTWNFLIVDDGHLSYNPNCYRQFVFFQPFFFVGVPFGNDTRLFVYSVDVNSGIPWVANRTLTTLNEYNGAELILIDGQPAVEALQAYADGLYGKSRSSVTRFNKVIAFRYFDSASEDFLFDRGAFGKRNVLPDNSNVTYSFQLPGSSTLVNATIPWVAIALAPPFTNAYDYWTSFCQVNPQNLRVYTTDPNSDIAPGVGQDAVNATVFVDAQGNQTASDVDPDGQNRTGLPPSPTDPVHVGPSLGFFVLSGTPRVGVLAIPDFETVNHQQWAEDMRLGFMKFNDLGVEKLILDLSNNGGGYICLAYALVAMLNPPLTPAPFPIPHSPFPTSVRLDPSGSIITDLSTAALNSSDRDSSPFYLGNFMNPSTYEPFSANDTNWSANSTSANPNPLYSRPVMDDCVSTDVLHTSGLDKVPMGPLRGENVTILTNGFCGSSCSIVVGNLQLFGNATGVYITGQALNTSAGNPLPPIYSFAGGQVLTSEDFFTYLYEFGVQGHPLAPQPFLTSADITFTYRKQYLPGADMDGPSLEYLAIPANYSIPVTAGNAMRPSRAWRDAAAVVGWLPPATAWACDDPVVTNCPSWLTGRLDGFVSTGWTEMKTASTGAASSSSSPSAAVQSVSKTASAASNTEDSTEDSADTGTDATADATTDTTATDSSTGSSTGGTTGSSTNGSTGGTTEGS